MMVKRFFILLSACVLLASCTGNGIGWGSSSDSTAVTRSFLEKGKAIKEDNADSALVLILNAVDYGKGCEPQLRYDVYKIISEMYEAKNISDQQQKYQRLMADAAKAMNNKQKEAEAFLRISMTDLTMGELDRSLTDARKAYKLALADSLEFKANCQLMQTQVFLQKELADSADFHLKAAKQICPQIIEGEMYRLSEAYVLSAMNDNGKMETAINEYKADGSVFLSAELTRLLMSTHESLGNWQKAYRDATELLQLTDSISQKEASESMARIHELQHEQQMERNRADRESERATLFFSMAVVLFLLLMASLAALFFRKKAIVAHANELEALQLADNFQASEAIVKEENRQLQKLYYEHLYAIILPIMNANRGKSGHINLEEHSWKLIEENTDMVIPDFTSKLRRSHPSLTAEDVRFCCLVSMRVPNSVIADVYGIAASSVSTRKHRMKKKLDADIHEQTIEDYLGQYFL
ncbi:MAG: hypothetical protein MJZ29_02890 [Bacteroidaceae bacterium]|nr:hypothetical protein [Bacteroidaceae bacterium]